VKKAYRKMANKYHPDKVAHLGDELQKLAEDKFKAVNDAYHQIKKDRGMA
jgi:DnaJ like chaperone protein